MERRITSVSYKLGAIVKSSEYRHAINSSVVAGNELQRRGAWLLDRFIRLVIKDSFSNEVSSDIWLKITKWAFKQPWAEARGKLRSSQLSLEDKELLKLAEKAKTEFSETAWRTDVEGNKAGMSFLDEAAQTYHSTAWHNYDTVALEAHMLSFLRQMARYLWVKSHPPSEKPPWISKRTALQWLAAKPVTAHAAPPNPRPDLCKEYHAVLLLHKTMKRLPAAQLRHKLLSIFDAAETAAKDAAEVRTETAEPAPKPFKFRKFHMVPHYSYGRGHMRFTQTSIVRLIATVVEQQGEQRDHEVDARWRGAAKKLPSGVRKWVRTRSISEAPFTPENIAELEAKLELEKVRLPRVHHS